MPIDSGANLSLWFGVLFPWNALPIAKRLPAMRRIPLTKLGVFEVKICISDCRLGVIIRQAGNKA